MSDRVYDPVYIDKGYVKQLIGTREKDSHKGNYGRILIIAGSYGMAGAAALCAKGALRSGAGLVKLCVPERILPTVQSLVIEATCTDRLPDEEEMDAYDAIAIGSGLGRSDDACGKLIDVIQHYDGKLVIDADGLNLIAEHELFDMLGESSCRTVITPHIGEARRLMGKDIDPFVSGNIREKAARIMLARSLAEKTWSTVLLKGAGTVITDGRDTLMINSTGNPGMATGGSGDVLTGIICSLMGQGLSETEAAAAGAFIHGYAGDLAASKWGEAGLTAGDLTGYTALAIKEITG